MSARVFINARLSIDIACLSMINTRLFKTARHSGNRMFDCSQTSRQHAARGATMET